MTRIQPLARVAALLLAALIAAGCGGPAAPSPTPTGGAAAPAEPAPAEPTPAGPATAYPPPAPSPTFEGYPPPPTVDPNPSPYPAPTQSGAAPAPPADAAAGSVGAGNVPVTSPAGGVVDTGLGVATTTTGTPITRVSVVATYPHDPRAYTQGLVYMGDDTLFEGTGNYADSSLREVALATGEVRRIKLLTEAIPPTQGRVAFGEGIAVAGERIFQLTWQDGRGVIYDLEFNKVGEFTYPPEGQALPVEGWGLTYDPGAGRLIMSDGTANLYFVDPAATEATGVLAITGQVEVRDDLGPLPRLNELELVGDEVFANIYLDIASYRPTDRPMQEWIARIDPATGRVNGYLDLSELRALLSSDPSRPPPEALNGIAYDAAGDRLFVTGKWWPSLFEIDLPAAVGPLPVRAYLPIGAIVPPTLTRLWS